MTRSWMMAACALLLLAAPARADDGNRSERPRHWSVGWESGLTLRRSFDTWDVSVTAGPADWLDDEDTYTWSPTLPDSLQGIRTNTSDDRTESGFVRIGAARELTRWRDFSLHGTAGAGYEWADSQHVSETYRAPVDGYDRRVTDTDSGEWTVSLGLRFAWRPVPFLGIQTRLGLTLATETYTTTVTDYDADQQHVTRTSRPGRHTRFFDYGYSGTAGLEIFVWF